MQPSLESTVSRYNTSDDVQETEIETTNKKQYSKKYQVLLPLIKGVLEQIRRVFEQYDVLTYFKPMNTLCQLLVTQKDKILNERVAGPVNLIPCGSCDASYIGEDNQEHQIHMEEVRIKAPEGGVREAINIRMEQPS